MCECSFNIKDSNTQLKLKFPTFHYANSAKKTILIHTYLCTHVSHRLESGCDMKKNFFLSKKKNDLQKGPIPIYWGKRKNSLEFKIHQVDFS